jgi:phosphatidylserine/phosphatidylglycerophosphate/cardiolipin synthase-like enzyme
VVLDAGDMTHRRVLAVVVVLVVVVAWHLSAAPPVSSGGVAALPLAAPPGAAGDSLIVEPDDGMSGIDDLLASPRRTLDLTMYELSDPTAESLLAADVARGVRVRVLLDGGFQRSRNTPAYDFLTGRGVQVYWSSRRYTVTHQKTIVIDGSTAVVMSLNFTAQYYATSRDVAVVDRDRHDVAAIERVFDADIRGSPTATPAADDLVWSPGQSAADLVALVEGARRSIDLESEELSSEPVVAALAAAARRGVSVRLAMTYQSDWVANFDRLTAAGVRVSVMRGETPLYIHAKLLIVDAGTPHGRAFVGSENLSATSLLHDRELGVVLVRPSLVSRLETLVDRDVADGEPWPG